MVVHTLFAAQFNFKAMVFFSHIDSDGFPILQMTLAIIKSCLDPFEKK